MIFVMAPLMILEKHLVISQMDVILIAKDRLLVGLSVLFLENDVLIAVIQNLGEAELICGR